MHRASALQLVEEMADDDPVVLGSILRELKNTRLDVKEARTESQGVHQQITKLTQKIAQFKSLVVSVSVFSVSRHMWYTTVHFSFRKSIMI